MKALKFSGCISLYHLETENMKTHPVSLLSLTANGRQPFNLVPLQMSERQRASSVTAIDQALFSTAAAMDGASQGRGMGHQSCTSQLALTSSLQRMPSLNAQTMSFTHIITMT